MIVAQSKFLKLSAQEEIRCCMKSYCDTILFYYLGHLALSLGNGELSEIGVGGSTFTLTELSELSNRTFFVFDKKSDRLRWYTDTTRWSYWPKSNLKLCEIDSKDLDHRNFPKFSYCHVDGSKDFNITLSDLRFYLNNLSENGLICQDDYGNNKWPTIVDVIKTLENNNEIKIIMVGDSSIWITKPEYYKFWIDTLDADPEFFLLTALCNITSSEMLGQTAKYFFLQSCFNKHMLSNFSESEQEYFSKVKSMNSPHYLQMPYATQSTLGLALEQNVSFYQLSDIYESIKTDDWPSIIPVTKEDIDQLPNWIKTELIKMHGIDPYKQSVRGPNEFKHIY